MQRLPLIGGSYSARSVIANAQRCLNLFPESNRKDSPVPLTHYQRPGLAPLVAPAVAAPGRAIYQASNGDGYAIIGGTLYYITPFWVLVAVGSVTAGKTNPCSMIDNGIQLVVVDGAPATVTAQAYATGSITFVANPLNGSTITLNGQVITFLSPGTGAPNTVGIGATMALTAANLYTMLLLSVNPLLVVASAYNTFPGGNWVLNITYRTIGAVGNSYTLAASFATPSGPTLTGGGGTAGGGWTVDLATRAGFTAINDTSWTGADRVDYIDTFVIWNQPGTNRFGSTLSNQIVPLDPTYTAGKTSYPDQLQSIIVNDGEIVLPGSLKSEVWYDAGSPLFPFARLPGATIEHGLGAKYSIATADVNTYWLMKDLQGTGMVLRKRGYETVRISNHALEYQIGLMAAAGTISDAVGYTYQQGGHVFYVLSFPTGDQTWVWDESIGDPELGWSQRGWSDANGQFHRDRGVLGAVLYGKNVVLDWENGTLYEQSLTTYVDRVAGTDYPIQYLRTFPHLMAGLNPVDGKPILAEGKMVQHDRFQLDAECGTTTGLQPPQFSLRWSDDRGRTWGNPQELSAGAVGKYTTRPDIRTLGQAMDRVYEVSWSFPGPVALNGAWVEGRVLNQ